MKRAKGLSPTQRLIEKNERLQCLLDQTSRQNDLLKAELDAIKNHPAMHHFAAMTIALEKTTEAMTQLVTSATTIIQQSRVIR